MLWNPCSSGATATASELMSNPFLRRATEYIRDDSAFLSIVSPEPLTAFVAKHKKRPLLFQQTVRVIGTPGSGKTMMASLVEFRLVENVLRDQNNENNRLLARAFAASGFTADEVPTVAAVRIPMESEYRDFWEMPYDAAVKTKLILSLIQARTVLALVRNLTANGRRTVESIRFIARDNAGAQLDQIGGTGAEQVLERARAVERAIYSIGASLVPPAITDIPIEARDPYQPFEAILNIEIDWNEQPVRIQPMVILDDVHTLHPDQFDALFRALARREIRFARWMMMRMDALSPNAIFRSADEDALPGLKSERDYVDIFMQSDGRTDDRRQFRKMATDMADRYLRLVEPLRDRQYERFRDLLKEEPPALTLGQFAELKSLIDREQKQLEIPASRRRKIEDTVARYVKGAKSADFSSEVILVMVRVLMHRYAIRTTGQTRSLFPEQDPEPKQALTAKSSVADAARIMLHQLYGRPLHFGLEDLCDASNENAEIFLQLAGALVARMETKAIRNQDPALTPAMQQSALADKAREIVDGWAFPFSRTIRALIDRIAKDCIEVSSEPNASLGAGANAIAVPESEMKELLGSGSELASALKYAIAYAGIVAVRDYGQGGKSWCLLELAGPVCLKYGLTLKRGGFLERHVSDLLPPELLS
jgi:hypothetical protein